MKKAIIVWATIFSFATLQATSQEYSTGLGFKFGGIQGISVKQFLGGSSAVEVIVGSRWRGIEALVLYEIHAEAFSVPGLYWYYGGGGHLGFWKGHDNNPFDNDQNEFIGIGVDGVLGMEYKIQNIPITISLDVVPAFNIVEDPDFWLDGGLGLRYVF